MSADMELYIRVLKAYAGPQGWAQLQRHGAYLTKEELVGFMTEYFALLDKYGHRREDAPEGARPMSLRFFAAPDETPADDA